MAITPPRLVGGGYYRVNSYVLLGVNVLAAAVVWLNPSIGPLWPSVAAAVLSYASSILWLYEKPRTGVTALALIAGVTLCGAWLSGAPQNEQAISSTWGEQLLAWLDPVSGGLVLGVTTAAMLLGHWYLNSPGMKLAPLRRLVLLIGGSLLLRAAVCSGGFLYVTLDAGMPGITDLLFLSLRWLAGIFAAAVVVWMTWQTLKIPNTQSATGVLYVAVILTFIGELTGLLLSTEFRVPL